MLQREGLQVEEDGVKVGHRAHQLPVRRHEAVAHWALAEPLTARGAVGLVTEERIPGKYELGLLGDTGGWIGSAVR